MATAGLSDVVETNVGGRCRRRRIIEADRVTPYRWARVVLDGDHAAGIGVSFLTQSGQIIAPSTSARLRW